jgi:choline kinase
MRNDKADYAFAKIGDILKELGGEKVDFVEESYGELSKAVYGFVRNRSFSEKDAGTSIFIAAETPVDRIVKVVGHEFYHFRYSPPGITNAEDEKAADDFGLRIEREMQEAAREEATQEWCRKFREVQSRRK